MDIENTFRYHAPSEEQNIAYQELREAARKFAYAILAKTPICADQTAAVRHVREALFTANAAIALDGKL